MAESKCKNCGKPIKRNGSVPGVFCNFFCKGEWQRAQKPVDKVWLEQKYIAEGLSTYAIAKIVDRNPKQVWNWIKDYGIPVRERQWDTTENTRPYHDESWLRREYIDKHRSSREIADYFGVTENNILHFLEKYGIDRRTISEARGVKHWGLPGEDNPQFGKKGALSGAWKGGSTPERQAVYGSIEWKNAVKAVRKRDKRTCRRCGIRKGWRDKILIMHIHHIISFINPATRTDPNNLVLLCIDCHHWVHGKENINREFISE